MFREYLGELFTRGYSVEYFVEGAFADWPPVGAENRHLVDDDSGHVTWWHPPYHVGADLHRLRACYGSRDLRQRVARRDKEKENLLQMLRGLRKLRNLGQGYVNFGEPCH